MIGKILRYLPIKNEVVIRNNDINVHPKVSQRRQRQDEEKLLESGRSAAAAKVGWESVKTGRCSGSSGRNASCTDRYAAFEGQRVLIGGMLYLFAYFNYPLVLWCTQTYSELSVPRVHPQIDQNKPD
jgi:hypothetical protein